MRSRWLGHLKNLRKGNHHSALMQADFNEHGIDFFGFKVLHVIKNPETDLRYHEQDHINLWQPEYNTGAPLGRRNRCLQQVIQDGYAGKLDLVEGCVDGRKFIELSPDEQVQRTEKVRARLDALTDERYLRGDCKRGIVSAWPDPGARLGFPISAKVTQKHNGAFPVSFFLL